VGLKEVPRRVHRRTVGRTADCRRDRSAIDTPLGGEACNRLSSRAERLASDFVSSPPPDLASEQRGSTAPVSDENGEGPGVRLRSMKVKRKCVLGFTAVVHHRDLKTDLAAQ